MLEQKSEKTMGTNGLHGNVEETDKENFGGEMLMQNIVIPNSQFCAKWQKDIGYSVGIENVKLSKDYETLEEALNQIGYGVENDELMKVGETDFEMIARIVKAIILIEEDKNNG